MNLATLVGRVGKEPVTRLLNSGKRVSSFSLATSDRWKDKDTGEKKEKTEWHNIVVFSDGLAGVVEKYVKKGMQLSVMGAIRTSKYTGQDGSDKYKTDIVITNGFGSLEMLGSHSGDSDSSDRKSSYDSKAESSRDYGKAKGGEYFGSDYNFNIDDDLPF